MRPALVSIAAGKSQLSLLEAARARGLAIVAVDRDRSAPGFELADVSIVHSTHDSAGILAALDPLRSRWDLCAVATKSSGMPVATTAEIAHALGLPGLDPEWARLSVTKPGTMRMAERAGVPVPRHVVCTDEEDARLEELPFPRVVKPALPHVGKAGVAAVRERSEFRKRFGAARDASADGRVEVEELIAGVDVILATVFVDSVLEPIVLIDEDTRFDDAGQARGYGLALPSSFMGTSVEADVIERTRRLVGELRLGTGVGFFTFRVNPRERTLIEVHFDLAGDYLADRLFAGAGTFSLIDATLDALTGAGLPTETRSFQPTDLRFLFERDLPSLDGLRDGRNVLALEVEAGLSLGAPGGCTRRDLVGGTLGSWVQSAAQSDPWRRVGFLLSRGTTGRRGRFAA